MIPAFILVCKRYGWVDVAGLSSTEPLYLSTLAALKAEAPKTGINTVTYTFPEGSESVVPGSRKAVLQSVAEKNIRIVLLLMYPSDCRDIFLTAIDAGFYNNKWAYITNALTANYHVAAGTWMPEDGRDEELARRSNGLLSLTLASQETPMYREWEREVRRVAEKKFGYAMSEDQKIDSYAQFVPDSIMLYAHAFTQVLSLNENPLDINFIMAGLKNVSFLGISGLIDVDKNGNNKQTWALDNKQGVDWVTVAHLTAEYEELAPTVFIDGSEVAPTSSEPRILMKPPVTRTWFFVIVNIIGICVSMCGIGIFIHFSEHPLIKASGK